MIEPADGGTGYLKALLDSKIDTPVGNNEVATLSKGKDYAGIVENHWEYRIEDSVPRKSAAVCRAQGPCAQLPSESVHQG